MPYLYVTLTADDLLRPFLYNGRSLLKLRLGSGTQALDEVLENNQPGVPFRMIYAAHFRSAATWALNPKSPS